MFGSKNYSLHKCKRILAQGWSLYRKKRQSLVAVDLNKFENQIKDLQASIQAKDRSAADLAAHQLEEFCQLHFAKPWWKSGLDIVFALIFALMVAIVIRLSWFEIYEIPTGSMRPSFKEQDHLTVSKTAFGINIPMATGHFYFDPNLVQRTSAIILSGDNLPVIETDTTFLGVLPYKKRFIKRMIGKPGDTLYFYGGKIYGIDQDGKPIAEFLDSKWMASLEYIPFITFEGIFGTTVPNQVVFQQMHLPIGRVKLTRQGISNGEFFNGKDWVNDNPAEAEKPHSSPVTFSDLWGIGNFAMARLVTKEQAKEESNEQLLGDNDVIFYLELQHHPSLTYPKPQLYNIGAMTGIAFAPEKSFLPVTQKHLEAIRDHLYTSRFVVKNERVARYSVEGQSFSSKDPQLPGVPDGTYEFYFGKGWSVDSWGITSPLPEDHPLYNKDPLFIKKLYNLGINWDTAIESKNRSARNFPARYAYFRSGDLFLLGGKIYEKEDPVLSAFNQNEEKRTKEGTLSRPYQPFRDSGPPSLETIKSFGLTIPDKQYLVLGDNHAMSGDSRIFGFVPEANLQGAPSFIFWPPGERFGIPNQKPYPIFVLPRLIVWGIVLVIAAIWFVIHRRHSKIRFGQEK